MLFLLLAQMLHATPKMHTEGERKCKNMQNAEANASLLRVRRQHLKHGETGENTSRHNKDAIAVAQTQEYSCST